MTIECLLDVSKKKSLSRVERNSLDFHFISFVSLLVFITDKSIFTNGETIAKETNKEKENTVEIKKETFKDENT